MIVSLLIECPPPKKTTINVRDRRTQAHPHTLRQAPTNINQTYFYVHFLGHNIDQILWEEGFKIKDVKECLNHEKANIKTQMNLRPQPWRKPVLGTGKTTSSDSSVREAHMTFILRSSHEKCMDGVVPAPAPPRWAPLRAWECTRTSSQLQWCVSIQPTKQSLITRCSSIIKPWHYRTLGIKEVSDDWQCWCVHFKRMYSKWNWNFQKRKLPNEEWSQNCVTCCEFSTWIFIDLYPNKTENSSASVIRRSKRSNAFKLAVNTTELPLKRQTALRGAAGCTSLSYICLRSPQLAVIYILITQMERRVHIQRRDAVWFSVPKKWAQAR